MLLSTINRKPGLTRMAYPQSKATFNMKLMKLAIVFVVCFVWCVNHQAAIAERPNVLFIAIDDLRTDLGAYGATHAKTPQLDSFASTARVFTHHYVQVPTCGASRCALWRGRYPAVPSHLGNDAIKQTQREWGAQSLPAVFRKAGYQTLAIGKLTHYPGGLTGKDWVVGPEELEGAWTRTWVPSGPWNTPKAIMHGYAGGAARTAGNSPPWEAQDGPDSLYPDAWVAEDAVKTLHELSAQRGSWFLAVGFFKPHLPFAAPKRWHDLHESGVPDLNEDAAAKPTWPSGWHRSSEFRSNYSHESGKDPAVDTDYQRQVRRAYAASVSYVDSQVGRVLDELRHLGLESNTIVVVWSDHGFLLGEHAIWGKHCLYEHALRSPLMIRHPGLPQPGQPSSAVVESVDVFPTLAELCELPVPTDLDGRSLQSQLRDPATPGTKPARGFWNNGQCTVRTDRWRLIAHPRKEPAEPFVELFDYATDPDETRNWADANSDIVTELLKIALPSTKTR